MVRTVNIAATEGYRKNEQENRCLFDTVFYLQETAFLQSKNAPRECAKTHSLFMYAGNKTKQ